MNWAERLHRLTLEVIIAGILWWMGKAWISRDISWVGPLLISHTLNAVLNGHLVALWGHAYGLPINRQRDRFINYLLGITTRLQSKRPAYLDEVLVMGSIVRGELRPTSDVDMALIARPDPWSVFKAINYLLLERVRALFFGFPLDAYIYLSKAELETKMRIHEEPPLVLYSLRSGRVDLGDLRNRIRLAKLKQKPLRMVLVAPPGGHLIEVQSAVEGLPLKRTFATPCLPHIRESLEGEAIYYLVDPQGNLLKYLINLLQSIRLILKVRPHAVLSTGGGMTIAPCLVGKLLGAKLIYVESGARVKTLSRTGRLLYPWADLFIVQWPALAEQYPKAVYGGVLL